MVNDIVLWPYLKQKQVRVSGSLPPYVDTLL